MTCTKTGANIFIRPHRTFAYGDAYEVGGIAFFRIVVVETNSGRPAGFNPIHYSVSDYTNWFDQGQPTSTLVSADFVNHGYDGVAIEEVL